MRVDQIKNERVRRAITGSATPASDILAAYGELPTEALREAQEYFAYCGGLHTAAKCEQEFMRIHDC